MKRRYADILNAVLFSYTAFFGFRLLLLDHLGATTSTWDAPGMMIIFACIGCILGGTASLYLSWRTLYLIAGMTASLGALTGFLDAKSPALLGGPMLGIQLGIVTTTSQARLALELGRRSILVQVLAYFGVVAAGSLGWMLGPIAIEALPISSGDELGFVAVTFAALAFLIPAIGPHNDESPAVSEPEGRSSPHQA